MSNTRSNSRGSLSASPRLISMPPACSRTSMRPCARRISSITPVTAGRRAGSRSDTRPVPPARVTDSTARSAASRRSMPSICLSMATGVGFSPRAFASSISASFNCSRSARSSATCGSPASGASTRSSRKKVPPLDAARSATIALVMPPAAPVTTKTLSLIEREARPPVGRGLLLERERPPQAVSIPDLHDAGVHQRLGRAGHPRRARRSRRCRSPPP